MTKSNPRKGVPTVFTPEKQQRFVDLVATGVRPARAAQAVQVSIPTLYRMRQINVEFAEKWQEAEEIAAAPVEEMLYEMALAGDKDAIKMWLTNRMPHRWKDQRRVAIDQEVTVTLELGPAVERIQELRKILDQRHQNVLELEGYDDSINRAPALPSGDDPSMNPDGYTDAIVLDE